MADLFILLPDHDGAAPLFAWREGGAWVTGTALPDVRFGRGEGAVAFVPGPAVSFHTVDVAARKPVEARRIALFALEDELAEPVDQVHVALAPPAAEGNSRTIAVASRADMQEWTDWLDAAGLPDAALVAPQSCLPQQSLAISAPGEMYFRADGNGFALDGDAPEELVKALAPARPDLVYGERLAALLDAAPTGPAFAAHDVWLKQLAEWHEERLPAELVSLRQGDFGVRRPLSFDGLARWRAAAVLAVACFVLWLGSVWLETRALDAQARDLRAQTNQLVAAVAPDANGQLSAAMEELRRDQRIASSALRPTYAAAALYEALAPVSNAEIRSLRYDAGNARLTATVVFDNYSEADAIGERLEESGLAVSLGEARQSGNRVTGELVIEGRT